MFQSKDYVSFFGALSLRTGEIIAQLSGKRNSESTCQFLDKIKVKYQDQINEQGGRVLLIWDGASYHKSKKIREWLKDNPGIVELMLLPPYSPELNPQEQVWKALRKYLYKVAGEYTFDQTINRACRFLLTHRFNFNFPWLHQA